MRSGSTRKLGTTSTARSAVGETDADSASQFHKPQAVRRRRVSGYSMGAGLDDGPGASRQPRPPTHHTGQRLVTILPGWSHLRYAGGGLSITGARGAVAIHIE